MTLRSVFAALGLLAGIALPPISAAAAGFLHASGQQVVDEQGQPVLLRGVGLGNWLLPEGYMWKFGERGDRPRTIEKLVRELIGPENATRFWTEFRNHYITEADIRSISELGFNCVRPALNARLFVTEGNNPTPVPGFELLDHLVSWCKKHHLYVVIDMHAAPGGQTGANIDDSADDQPRLFMDKANQDRLVELWVQIARRYKDEPAVGAFDLLNEPLPERTGAEAKFKALLEPLYQRLTTAVRQVDTRHMITLEGADWANDWSVFSKPFDSNLLYQFHYYCWDRPNKLNDISRFLTQRDRLDAPIWVGETGEKDPAIYWATTEYFEANRVGWSFWPWKKMDTLNTPYSIKPPAGWDRIKGYSSGGPKPTAEDAQKILDQLLENIRLENCQYFPEVVSAILRQVPGRIEAENYAPGGLNKSYFVRDTTRKSKYYRPSEAVPVELMPGTKDRWSSEQAITLNAGEWTAYLATSLEARGYQGKLRVASRNGPAVIRVSLDGQSQERSARDENWSEIPLGTLNFSKGLNHLKVLVKRGQASIDWLDFR